MLILVEKFWIRISYNLKSFRAKEEKLPNYPLCVLCVHLFCFCFFRFFLFFFLVLFFQHTKCAFTWNE